MNQTVFRNEHRISEIKLRGLYFKATMRSLHRLFISCKRKSSSYHGYISEKWGNICVTYRPGLGKLFLKGPDTKYFFFFLWGI